MRIKAHNSFGYGTVSSANTAGAKIRRIPDTMSAPTITAYSDTSITVSWTPLSSPNNGNSDILSYRLRWDSGTGTIVTSPSLSDVLTTSYVVTGITPGTAYKFVVAARNIYGYSSADSPVTTATAVDAPGKMDIATVATDTGDNTKVAITWPAATVTHGSAVDSYAVEFKKADGTFVTDASCDPIAASTQFTNRKCVVSMTTIISVTGLAVDRVIQVRVSAHNSDGWGEPSEINTSGATIETTPLVMDPVSFDIASSSNTNIKLTWTALTGTATGGSSVSIT